MAVATGCETIEGFATDGKRPEVFGTVVLFTYNNK